MLPTKPDEERGEEISHTTSCQKDTKNLGRSRCFPAIEEDKVDRSILALNMFILYLDSAEILCSSSDSP
ncbi:hypothetical protein TNCV_3257021 [Trichonephila clavipes]|nr:hypothetical protein TNCV_3257021 [Trichonephila clavipes]